VAAVSASDALRAYRSFALGAINNFAWIRDIDPHQQYLYLLLANHSFKLLSSRTMLPHKITENLMLWESGLNRITISPELRKGLLCYCSAFKLD